MEQLGLMEYGLRDQRVGVSLASMCGEGAAVLSLRVARLRVAEVVDALFVLGKGMVIFEGSEVDWCAYGCD